MTAAIDALLQRRLRLRESIAHHVTTAAESMAEIERSNADAASCRAQLAEIERAIVALGGKIPRAEEEPKPR
jgi:transcription elongation GreA/GreB family factor